MRPCSPRATTANPKVARDRLDGDHRRGSIADGLCRLPPSLPVGPVAACARQQTTDLVAAVLEGALDGAFVAGPIAHADLVTTSAFREELVLVSARRWSSLAELARRHAESGPTALVFRTGCTYRQRLKQILVEFGWPSAVRFELGTLDGMIGCVAADIGVTLLPRIVVERSAMNGSVSAPRARAPRMPASRHCSSSAVPGINTARLLASCPA